MKKHTNGRRIWPIFIDEATHIDPAAYKRIAKRLGLKTEITPNPDSNSVVLKAAVKLIREQDYLIYGYKVFKEPVECKCPGNEQCRRDCDLPKRDTVVKQTKPIGVITRDRRVFLNFIRFDLGATSTEGYVQIEHIDHTRGRQFSKVYVFNHHSHWFPGTTEIIQHLDRRNAEIIYV